MPLPSPDTGGASQAERGAPKSITPEQAKPQPRGPEEAKIVAVIEASSTNPDAALQVIAAPLQEARVVLPIEVQDQNLGEQDRVAGLDENKNPDANIDDEFNKLKETVLQKRADEERMEIKRKTDRDQKKLSRMKQLEQSVANFKKPIEKLASPVDKLKHRKLQFLAEREDVENVDRFNELVEYFESSQRGFEVGKVQMPVLIELAKSVQDPVPLLIALKPVLHADIRLDNDDFISIKRLLEAPHLDEAIALLGGIKDIPHLYWGFKTGRDGKPGEVDRLIELAESEKVSSYSTDFFEKVDVLSTAMRESVSLDDLPKYEALLNNPTKFNFLVTALNNGYFPDNYLHDKLQIFNILDNLDSAGLAIPLTVLMKNQIFIPRIFEGYEGSGDERVKVIQADVNRNLLEFVQSPSVQDFLINPDKQDFARVINKLSNGEMVNIDNVDKFFGEREKIIALNNLIFEGREFNRNEFPYGFESAFDRDAPLSKIEELLSHEDRVDLFLSPEFKDFISKIDSTPDFKLEAADFFNEVSLYPNQYSSYRDGNLITGLFKAQNVIEYLGKDKIPDIIKNVRSDANYEKKNEASDKFRKYVKLIWLGETITLLKENDIQVPEGEKADEWLSNVSHMYLLRTNFVDGLSPEMKKRWVEASLKIPENLQESLANYTRLPYDPQTKNFNIDVETFNKVVDLGNLISTSDLFSQGTLDNKNLQDVYSAMVSYRGNINELFTNGRPNIEFAKFAVELDQLEVLLVVLDKGVLSQADREQYGVVLETVNRIRNSPSAEIKRLEKELIGQLWKLDNPQQALEEIIGIFERNNLPLVAKIYRVFEIIYDNPNTPGATILEQTLASGVNLSPVLKAADARTRREIIYRDLLTVHIKSGNPQLRDYLEVLRDGEQVVSRLESDGLGALTDREKVQLDHFLNKMDMLYISSLFGRTIENRKKARDIDSSATTSTLDSIERVQALKKNFHVRGEQKLTDRLSEMFLRPTGIDTIEGVLAEMNRAKVEADARNRAFAQKNQEKIELKAGDRFKGVSSENLGKILERGAVAREYLGASAGSDATPYDTDTGLILDQDLSNGVVSAMLASPSPGYGDLLLVVRDRGQFGSGQDQYESFSSGTERHFGIRTGFPSSEIDAIIAGEFDTRRMDDLFVSIVQHGQYIPVATSDGLIILTPEKYDEYRKIFDGVSEYSSGSVVVSRVGIDETNYTFPESPQVVATTRAALDQLKTDISADKENVVRLSSQVRQGVSEALAVIGVNLRDEFDTSIYGAEFVDTGSTARGSNTPGEYDFDLSLQLDPNDFKRLAEISDVVKGALKLQEDKSHVEQDYVQVRAMGSEIVKGETLNIDIGIGKRADDGMFASSDAVGQKLESVREALGDEVYYDVLANIVLTKKVLKAGHAYKKLEDGGMGGIGVENWILLNNGNMLDAFQNFWNAAHEGGKVLSHEEFIEKYKIFDAGFNIKFNNHDNFARVLKPAGYTAMLSTIGGYLGYS